MNNQSENFAARGWEVTYAIRDREETAKAAEHVAAEVVDAARKKAVEAQRSAFSLADNAAASARRLKRARKAHSETKRNMIQLKRRASRAEACALNAAKVVEVGRCWIKSAQSVGRGGGFERLLVAGGLVNRVDAFGDDEVGTFVV